MSAGWLAQDVGEHGFLSDGQTAALICRDGTVDWLCLPRFDSEACFAALLGTGDNGGWWLRPVKAANSVRRCYRDDALVLETVFETEDGAVAVIDFMPPGMEGTPSLVRIVEGRRGKVAMASDLMPRFSYGRTHPFAPPGTANEIVAKAGPDGLVLRADTPIEHDDNGFRARFAIAKGERVAFSMTWFESHAAVPEPLDVEKALENTLGFWNDWSSRSEYAGFAASSVQRSLVVLKGLVHAATGGMVAAATASLPERPAGTRNWDYRFCWLRDAAFTLISFLKTGHEEEARAWIDWLRRAVAGAPIDVQPFYGIDGRRHSIEWEADWLRGFGDARPVRFGNGAVGQIQLDVYGEVIDTLYLAWRHGLSDGDREIVALLASRLETIWREPDAGIWEGRGDPQHHVYSKAMCWVAFDRAAKMVADERPDQARRWRDLAEEVRTEVLSKGFDAEVGAFTRAYEDSALDASVLRLPIVGFIDAQDERMVRTVAAIERQLCNDGYVYRYSSDLTDDGVGGAEGAFLAVGCWLADVLAMQGRLDDARALFDHMREAANDLGLLSEEFWLADQRAVGNLPQALSHVALINTALSLDADGKPPRLHREDVGGKAR